MRGTFAGNIVTLFNALSKEFVAILAGFALLCFALLCFALLCIARRNHAVDDRVGRDTGWACIGLLGHSCRFAGLRWTQGIAQINREEAGARKRGGEAGLGRHIEDAVKMEARSFSPGSETIG